MRTMMIFIPVVNTGGLKCDASNKQTVFDKKKSVFLDLQKFTPIP